MSIKHYWPTQQNIKDCIHIEAEELPEKLLLAIHEPMQFEHVSASGVLTNRSEDALVSEFLTSERPIPIVGKSGVGKSHVIRWLDARLRTHQETNDWLIVRIPKNASLRKTLRLILQDVEGPEFDEIKEKLEVISQSQTADQVAHFLKTQAFLELKEFHRDPERLRGLRDLHRYCQPSNLPTLVDDAYFSEYRLLAKNSPLRRVAERIMSGRALGDIEFGDYQFSGDDFDPGTALIIDNLAIGARKFFQQQRLATSEEVRTKVAQLLNLAVHEGSQNLVGNLLQLGAGGFTELFEKIRQQLLLRGKKLCILVEDMTAISAIEQVLIDSLLQEGVREGKRELCELRSAIAVTDGYPGYVMRRDTILTRSNGEWQISERVTDEHQFIRRTEAFISRYLNAARIGLPKLANDPGENPTPWEHPDAAETELEYFGRAKDTGVALFPFNRLAIGYLAKRHCYSDGEFRFNPRVIIRDLILGVLRPFRESFENSTFPPVGFMSAQSSTYLRRQLKDAIPDEWARADVVAGVWGAGESCGEIADLKKFLPPAVATAFGFSRLPEILDPSFVFDALESEPPSEANPETQPSPVPSSELEGIKRAVDAWFKPGGAPLSQTLGNLLRKELEWLIKISSDSALLGYGKGPINVPRDRNQLSIHLPNSAGRGTQDQRVLWFCSDIEFANPNHVLILQPIAIALLRNSYYRQRESRADWDYDQGWEDQGHVMNFAATWVPAAVKKLVDVGRESLGSHLREHWFTAMQLGMFSGEETYAQNLEKLLDNRESITARLGSPINQTLSAMQEDSMANWDRKQAAWLDLVSPLRRGLEFRLIKPQLLKLKDECLPINTLQKYRGVFEQIKQITETVDYITTECTADEIRQVMSLLVETAEIVRDAQLWPVSTELRSRQFISRVQSLLETDDMISTIKLLTNWKTATDIKKLEISNRLNGNLANEIHTLVQNWKEIFSLVNQELAMKRSPEEQELQAAKDSVSLLLTQAESGLAKLRELQHEQS